MGARPKRLKAYQRVPQANNVEEPNSLICPFGDFLSIHKADLQDRMLPVDT